MGLFTLDPELLRDLVAMLARLEESSAQMERSAQLAYDAACVNERAADKMIQAARIRRDYTS